MLLDAANLRPFKSFLLCETGSKEILEQVSDSAIDEIISLLGERKGVSGIQRQASQEGNLQIEIVYYRERSQTPWTSDEDFEDEINHLLLLCRHQRQFAVYASDSVLASRIRKLIISQKKASNRGALESLSAVPAGRLNAAFIKGQTQALWLSGTHRRVASKVDNKVITGLDLQYALDPLNDQSYFFTAARCRNQLSANSKFVGLSPKKSFLWAGQSSSWSDFLEVVLLILRKIGGQRKSQPEPFPVIAATIDESTRLQVHGAYDAVLIPPEIVDAQADDKVRQDAEKWSQMRFEVAPGKGPDFSADLYFESELLGTVTFAVELEASWRADWVVTSTSPHKERSKARLKGNDAVKVLQIEKDWLKVWYDSGHVLAEQGLFRLRYREFPFRNYVAARFGDYRRDQEKPKTLSAANIGKDKSLFSWVRNCWGPREHENGPLRGRLASNDGSMEIADFIHLDDAIHPPVLTLIHVKGAKRSKNKRSKSKRSATGTSTLPGISVSAYEVVTAQAIKNLRHVDQELLAGNFVERLNKRIRDAVWYNGEPTAREKMLNALKGITANYVRRVIVVQPRVSQSVLEKARNGKGAAQLRARQLDTLLLAAQASCQSLGAEFAVIIDDA